MTNLEEYKTLINSFFDFYSRQFDILNKEITIIKKATDFYRTGRDSQEIRELDTIYSGIEGLQKEAKKYSKTMHGNFPDFKKQITGVNNKHISALYIVDCTMLKLNNYFDELNFYKQSYHNLVESKEFSYIPSPKFNKRLRNTNIGLYLNRQLNQKTEKTEKIELYTYRDLVSKFYEDNGFAKNEEIEEFNKLNFFATWDYSTEYQIRNFNKRKENPDNIYLSMSYLYLDKAILQSIAYHEISHAMVPKNLPEKDTYFINQLLSKYKFKNIIHTNLIDSLYQEILCDLSAVYATGFSYIASLLHTGFFEFNIKHKFNYENYDFNNNKIDDGCIKHDEEIVPLIYDFEMNNIYIAVRLSILLKLYKKLYDGNIENEESKLNEVINGIEYMLNIMYPSENFKNDNPNLNTFETLYTFMEATASDYNISKNLVFMLSNEFESILFNKEFINNFKKIHIIRNEDFEKFNNKNLISKKLKNVTKHRTIFDLSWEIRQNRFYNNKIVHEKFVYRLYNIYNFLQDEMNDIFNETTNIKDIKDIFYDVTFIKYRAKKDFHPYISFNDDIADRLHDMKEKNIDIEYNYIFAPHDLLILKKDAYSQNESKQADKNNFDKIFPKEKYFTDRHALVLLYDKDGNGGEKYFNLVVQIKLTKIFNKKINQKFYQNIKKFFEDKDRLNDIQNKLSRYRIFKSLGSEDYLIYINDLSLNNSQLFGKQLKRFLGFKNVKNIEDYVLLNKKIIDETDLKIENDINIVSFSKINSEFTRQDEFFDSNEDEKPQLQEYLPDLSLINKTYLPTNRFDFIVNWKTQKNPFKNIYHSIKKYYYDNDENIFKDTNIEIMYKKQSGQEDEDFNRDDFSKNGNNGKAR